MPPTGEELRSAVDLLHILCHMTISTKHFLVLIEAVLFFCLTVGVVCKEPERTGISGPAGGAVLQVRAGERAASPVPTADW